MVPGSPAEYLDGAQLPVLGPVVTTGAGATDPYLGATINFYDSAGQLTATTDAPGAHDHIRLHLRGLGGTQRPPVLQR